MSSTDTDKVNFDKVNGIIHSCGSKKANLIAILQKIQEEFRYLPEDALTYIGTKIAGLSPATVYGVATFYNQFSLNPKGRYIIKVCDGTACHVRGSMPLLNALNAKLNLKEGKFTTDDMMFTVEIVSCLGACSLSPVIVVNGKVYPKMTPDALNIVIDALLKEERGEQQ